MNRGEIRTYHVSHDRPEAWAILVNNRGIQFHLDDIQGYNPVQQSIYVELMDAINGIGQSYHAANVLASGLNSPLLNISTSDISWSRATSRPAGRTCTT